MSVFYPRIKDDLKVQSDSIDGVVYYTVKEPISSKFIRLREPEYFLLSLLDGTKTSQQASEEFIRTYNKQITSDAIDQFVRRLGELGFFEGVSAAKPVKSKSILFIKLKAFNPERLLQRLYPRIHWLLTRPAILIQILLIIVGMTVFFANVSSFPFNVSRIFRAGDIAAIIISIFVIITIHEFAHALTCKKYGGNVREMGFLLLYFQPCFYCNLSDSYLFPEKRHRLYVTAAGVFYQLVLWSLFSLLWRLTVEGRFLNHIFYLTSAVCFATLVFNLNPAIKLDGYYLLADLLQIPNLRQKAFHYIWEGIRFKLLGCPADQIQPSPREARIFWRYGVFALLYSTLLIAFVLYRGGQFLISKWGGFGFVLFAVLTLIIFRKLLTRSFRAISSVWSERKRVWMRPKRIVFYAAAIVVIVLLAILIRVNFTTGGTARLLAAESYVVTRVSPSLLEGKYFKAGIPETESSQLFQLSSSDYSVTQIIPRKTIGDAVNDGDTILVISSTQISGQLAEAISDIKKAEAQRRLLLSDPKVEAVATKRSEIRQAQAVYEAARKENNRIKELHDKKLVSDDDFERSIAQFNVASSAWDSKKSELKLLKSAPKIEEVESIDADIEKLQARRVSLEDQLKASTIICPFRGVVVGNADSKDLFSVARMESLIVEINLNESDLDVLNPGSDMELRVNAYPSMPQRGKVVKLKISPSLLAVASIPNNGNHLLPGMTGYAKVNCGKVSLASLSLRKVTRFFRLEFWSWF